MNAFGYVGQQTIDANGTVTDNPSAVDGTWTGAGGLSAKGAANVGPFSYQSGMVG